MNTIAEEEGEDLRKLQENPPTPLIEEQTRVLGDGWSEYATSYGRFYYHNQSTGESRWKPPRRKPTEPEPVFVDKLPVKRATLPGNMELSSHGSSRLSLPSESVMEERKRSVLEQLLKEMKEPKGVGRILRTGKLKTAPVTRNERKVKKKWESSFAVLTEFYFMFTTQTGTWRRFFKKERHPNSSRLALENAAVRKEKRLSSKENVYKLTSSGNEVLFRSSDSTEAEAWFHAVSLIISDLSFHEEPRRPRSADMGKELLAVRQHNRCSFTMSSCDSADGLSRDDLDSGPGSTDTLAREENKRNGADLLRAVLRPRNGNSFEIPGESLKQERMLKAWEFKYPTPPGWVGKYDPHARSFYYTNCITGKNWYCSALSDGRIFFTEKDTGSFSWLLPPVYPDVNPRALRRFHEWVRQSSKSSDV